MLRRRFSIINTNLLGCVAFSLRSVSSSPPSIKKRPSRPATKKETVFISSAASSSKIIATPLTAPAPTTKSSSNSPTTTDVDDVQQSESTVLSENQNHIVESALRGENIFITGFAGSGKSRVLHAVIEALDRKNNEAADISMSAASSSSSPSSSSIIRVAAPTGVAAMNIGGLTLHSLFKLSPGCESDNYAVETLASQLFQRTGETLRGMKVLIIDEISMVSPDLFEAIALICRRNFSNSPSGNANPFGDIQIIVSGDFLQLPPVVDKDAHARKMLIQQFQNQQKQTNNNNKNETKSIPKYCFQTQSWKSVGFKRFDLEHSFRQSSDLNFVNFLRSVRVGNPDMDFINTHLIRVTSSTTNQSPMENKKRIDKEQQQKQLGETKSIVKIRSRNMEVDRINQHEFSKVLIENAARATKQRKEQEKHKSSKNVIANKKKTKNVNKKSKKSDEEEETGDDDAFVGPSIQDADYVRSYHVKTTGVCSYSNGSNHRHANNDSRNKSGGSNNLAFLEDSSVARELTLCRGTKIMLLKNLDVSKGLVNGRLGTVVDFALYNAKHHFNQQQLLRKKGNANNQQDVENTQDEPSISSSPSTFDILPIVEFENQQTSTSSPTSDHNKSNNNNIFPQNKKKNGKTSVSRVMILPYQWEVKSGHKVVGTATQLPLRHAWAITAHKSQGLTLDRVEVDLQNFFEPGQGYVALSRARNAEGLTIVNQYQGTNEVKYSLRICSIAAEFQNNVEK